ADPHIRVGRVRVGHAVLPNQPSAGRRVSVRRDVDSLLRRVARISRALETGTRTRSRLSGGAGHQELARHENHTRAAQFRATVTQNANWKDGFRDLWRRIFWAINAPGQPPIKAKTCNVLSGVRQAPVCAADLSTP